jgi:hypothetical protein
MNDHLSCWDLSSEEHAYDPEACAECKSADTKRIKKTIKKNINTVQECTHSARVTRMGACTVCAKYLAKSSQRAPLCLLSPGEYLTAYAHAHSHICNKIVPPKVSARYLSALRYCLHATLRTKRQQKAHSTIYCAHTT